MKLSQTTDDDLKDAFGRFGTVTDAKIIMDRDTGRSRGFAFVSFSDTRDAEEALKKLNGEVRKNLPLLPPPSTILTSALYKSTGAAGPSDPYRSLYTTRPGSF